MSLNILVALDDSENARRAVQHVARFFPKDSHVNLFSVLEDTSSICDIQSPELTAYFLSQRTNFCALEEKKRTLIRESLQTARSILLEAGFNQDRISTTTQIREATVSKDIVKEAEKGYDILVMGRRGLSGIKELFAGSVSHKVLNLARDISVLLVN